MADELADLFGKFIDSAGSLAEQQRSSGDYSNTVVWPNFVGKVEQQKEFRELVTGTRTLFSGDFHEFSSQNTWSRHIHNFFCQSGYYLDVIRGKEVHRESSLSAYQEAFLRREFKEAYFVPIELVSFGQGSMDFGEFSIRRFSVDELNSRLRNSLNLVFYPYASVTEEKLELLSHYWFLCVEAISTIEQIGTMSIPVVGPTASLLWRGNAEPMFTEFPKPVEFAIRVLSLFDWAGLDGDIGERLTTREDWKSLRMPGFPFVLRVSDDFLSEPSISPDTSKLASELVLDQSGEEVGKVPEQWIVLNNIRTDIFAVTVNDLARIQKVVSIEEHGWQFIEIAMGYYTKAFLTSPNTDQLLSYVTSLEALLGEKGAGVTRRLAQRIGTLLSSGPEEHEKYSGRFKQLYDLRSSFVHGAHPLRKAEVADILDACLICRRAITRVLHILDALQLRIKKSSTHSSHRPGREELMTFLDLPADNREELAWLINEFPAGFPKI